MNVVFAVLLVAGVLLLALTAPSSLLSVLLDGTSAAVSLSLRLVGVYALWTGIAQIAEDAGLDRRLARLYRPVMARLFRGESERTQALVGLNLTANLLGLGAAATPLGIAAVEGMTKGESAATDNMLLFFILNVTSVQLLPTTVLALLTEAGAKNASSIILPSLISSSLTAVCGVLLVFACRFVARKCPIRMRKNRANALDAH